MYYYTYYTYEEWGRGYIGVRTASKVPPEQDTKYMGSYKDKTFKPTQKIILSEYKTATEAYDAEKLLHELYDVKNNPHFANQCNSSSNGFYVSHEQAVINGKKGGKVFWSKLTPEQRSEVQRKYNALRTPEQRSEAARKANQTKTPEQRREASRKGQQSRTLEKRREISRIASQAYLNNTTHEQRSEVVKRGHRNKTPEQKSKGVKKTLSQRWQCTETGYICNPGSLAVYQRARGIDTSKRIRLS